jgi:RNA polymerase sigma factor
MDSKQQLLNVSRIIAENDYLYQKLDKKLQIPMTDLIPLIGVSSKTVEKNRKYIIAACIAMKSDLEIIKGFLQAFMV